MIYVEIHGVDLIILKCYSFSSKEVNMIIFLHQAITWRNVDFISNHVLCLLSDGNLRKNVEDIIKMCGKSTLQISVKYSRVQYI